MNTNEPEHLGLPPDLPSGWPDAGTIERLANQFFQAPPGAAPTIPATDSLDPLSPLAGTAPPMIEFPGEGELRELLAQFVPAGGLGPRTTAVPAAPYYFLEYAAPEFPSDVVVPSTTGREPLDVLQIRRDFPILQERVNGRPLIWLDNAATT